MFVTLEVLERRHILKVIRSTNGNISQAARILGIDRRTLYRKLESYVKRRRAEIAVLNFVGGRFSDEPVNVTEDSTSGYIPRNSHGNR
jgi:DNA-binding phage protein